MADAPDCLEKVRKACKRRGATGVKGLGRSVQIMVKTDRKAGVRAYPQNNFKSF